MCLEATKFVFLSAFPLIETICLKIRSKSRPKIAKRPLLLDVRHSKTLLLKLAYMLPTKFLALERIAWEKSQHLVMLPLVSPPNDVWETTTEIPY